MPSEEALALRERLDALPLTAVTVTLRRPAVDQLRALAKRTGLRRSDLVCIAVDAFIEAHRKAAEAALGVLPADEGT